MMYLSRNLHVRKRIGFLWGNIASGLGTPGGERGQHFTAMHSFPKDFTQTAAPAAPADASWDEAFVRVESYLRAHRLESRVLLNEVVADIIREARERALGEAPVAAALRVMHERIGRWFSRAGYPGDWSDERARQQGRLALVLANVPGQWAGYFLSREPVPLELTAALASGVLRPGPELRLCSMPSAPLEFGFEDPMDLNSLTKKGWSMTREALLWLGAAGFFGAAWAASH